MSSSRHCVRVADSAEPCVTECERAGDMAQSAMRVEPLPVAQMAVVEAIEWMLSWTRWWCLPRWR